MHMLRVHVGSGGQQKDARFTEQTEMVCDIVCLSSIKTQNYDGKTKLADVMSRASFQCR